MATPKTFEEWATPVLGPYVWGENQDEWAKGQECWDAAQLAMRAHAGEGYDEYWQREYAEFNVDGADRGFGETVWQDSRLALKEGGGEN